MEKKMKVYFYGAGQLGREALERSQNYEMRDMQIAGFLDGNKTGDYCGYPVLPLSELSESDSIVIITVERSYNVRDIYFKLHKKGIRNIYWFQRGEKFFPNNDFLQNECQSCAGWGDLILPQAEIHVCDFCNLNCKGCAHFSPLFERKMPDFNVRIKDIEVLKERFSHIIKFYLMGGEPFLNPQIKEYVIAARRILPDTQIQIVTNGLLLLKINDDVFNVIRDNDIIVSVSVYRPTQVIWDRIVQRLENIRVRYIMRPFEEKQTFVKPLSTNPNSIYPHRCISDGCLNIYDGKISRCPTLMYIDKFNEKFGTSLPDKGILDLATSGANEILQMLEKRVPLCQYCVDNPIDWESCGKNIEITDFAVTV